MQETTTEVMGKELGISLTKFTKAELALDDEINVKIAAEKAKKADEEEAKKLPPLRTLEKSASRCDLPKDYYK
jgi:hypothetical protein